MIFKRISHLCGIIDVLTDVWVEDFIKTLVEVFVINVWADGVFDTSGVQVDVIIGVVASSDIGVEMLTDVNTNILPATMTTLLFAMSVP